jgi:hypothetical protein
VVAGADYLFAVQGGDEVSRLGTALGGSAYRADVGVHLALGPVELSPLARYEAYTMSFRGQTFLFTQTRYNDVKLDDHLLQFLITVGSRFW